MLLVHVVLAKKQQLICSRDSPQGSGIEHTRRLWRCSCRAELKTELVAILYKVNSSLLITSPSPCSQATFSPLLPPQQQKRAFLTRGPESQRQGQAKGEGEGNAVKLCHLLVRPLQRPSPIWLPDSWEIPLPEDYKNLSGNQLDWPSDMDIWGCHNKTIESCLFILWERSLVTAPCRQNSNHLSGSHSQIWMEIQAIRHLRKTFNMK